MAHLLFNQMVTKNWREDSLKWRSEAFLSFTLLYLIYRPGVKKLKKSIYSASQREIATAAIISLVI